MKEPVVGVKNSNRILFWVIGHMRCACLIVNLRDVFCSSICVWADVWKQSISPNVIFSWNDSLFLAFQVDLLTAWLFKERWFYLQPCIPDLSVQQKNTSLIPGEFLVKSRQAFTRPSIHQISQKDFSWFHSLLEFLWVWMLTGQSRCLGVDVLLCN